MKRDDWPPRVRVTKPRAKSSMEVFTNAFQGRWKWECQGCRHPTGERVGARTYTLASAWTAADDHAHSTQHNYRQRWLTGLPH